MRFLHHPVFSRDDSAKIHKIWIVQGETKKNIIETMLKINFYVYFCGEIIIYEKKLIIGIA